MNLLSESRGNNGLWYFGWNPEDEGVVFCFVENKIRKSPHE